MNLRLAVLAPSLLALVAATSFAADPPEVPYVNPVVRQVTDTADFTGRTEAAAGVELRARVTGYLDKALFREGAAVKKGDLLFEIDPRPYQAEVARAEANVALAEAGLQKAEANLQRLKALSERGAVSREEFDRAVSERAEAQAALVGAKAALESARLTLGFTKVTAPITGRVGRRLVDPGALVRADETVLATLVSEDPALVGFDVDERTYLRLRRAAAEGKGKDPVEAKATVRMGLADEEGFPREGHLSAADNRVDPKTGTLRMWATFPNPDGLLIPGLSARVRLPLGEPYKSLVIPEEAVQGNGAGAFVLVVGDKDVVERRKVVLGTRHGGLVVVKEGVTADDRVAVGNLRPLDTGVKVKPVKVPEPPRD